VLPERTIMDEARGNAEDGGEFLAGSDAGTNQVLSKPGSSNSQNDGCADLRGQELIVDILSIRFSMDKLGRSAKGPLAVLEWELCDQPA
jgi:hypothetical protein